MRRTWLIILALVGVLLTGATLEGCARHSPDASDEPALVSSAEAGPVKVRVQVDQDTMRTVDRARVVLIAMLAPGAELETFGFDTELEDWTIIDDRAETTLTDQGRVHRRDLVLEPFLEGTYEIPAVRARWRDEDRSGVALSEPLQVEVTSVLEPEDPLALGELRPVPAPPPETSGHALPVWTMVIAGIGVGLAVFGIAMLARRRDRPDAAEVILERLERIATGAEDVDQAGAEAAKALRSLESTPDEDTRRLIDRLDDARFERAGRDRMRDLLADALDHARRLAAAREAGA